MLRIPRDGDAPREPGTRAGDGEVLQCFGVEGFEEVCPGRGGVDRYRQGRMFSSSTQAVSDVTWAYNQDYLPTNRSSSA